MKVVHDCHIDPTTTVGVNGNHDITMGRGGITQYSHMFTPGTCCHLFIGSYAVWQW